MHAERGWLARELASACHDALVVPRDLIVGNAADGRRQHDRAHEIRSCDREPERGPATHRLADDRDILLAESFEHGDRVFDESPLS